MADDNGIDYFYTTLDTVSGLSNTNDLPTDPNLIMAPDISGIVYVYKKDELCDKLCMYYDLYIVL